MLFKLSNLNSNPALTLGYLNPALNNWVQLGTQQYSVYNYFLYCYACCTSSTTKLLKKTKTTQWPNESLIVHQRRSKVVKVNFVTMFLANHTFIHHCRSQTRLQKHQPKMFVAFINRQHSKQQMAKLTSQISYLRVVTKISSFRVNTTSRRRIKRLGISCGSIFLLFSNKSCWGPLSQQLGKIPGPRLLMTTLKSQSGMRKLNHKQEH